MEDTAYFCRTFFNSDLCQRFQRHHHAQTVADIDPADLIHAVSETLREANPDVYLTVAFDKACCDISLDFIPDLGSYRVYGHVLRSKQGPVENDLDFWIAFFHAGFQVGDSVHTTDFLQEFVGDLFDHLEVVSRDHYFERSFEREQAGFVDFDFGCWKLFQVGSDQIHDPIFLFSQDSRFQAESELGEVFPFFLKGDAAPGAFPYELVDAVYFFVFF